MINYMLIVYTITNANVNVYQLGPYANIETCSYVQSVVSNDLTSDKVRHRTYCAPWKK